MIRELSLEALEANTEYDPASGCWVWRGAKSRAGYGLKLLQVHRVVAEIVHGFDPDADLVMHLCDVRGCINPDHLRWGSRSDNMRDMWAKGRGWSPFTETGERNRAKTHCPQGHPYDDANTYRPPSHPDHRRCRRCNAERSTKAARAVRDAHLDDDDDRREVDA